MITATDEYITFEQPLNELTRVCLRLEHVFNRFQSQTQVDHGANWQPRAALTNLIGLLNITDRPDLKSKLSKAILDHTATMMPLQHHQEVDQALLRQILDQLEQFNDALERFHGRFAQSLRQNEFLNAIRQQQSNPGGACDFSTPALLIWLQQKQTVIGSDLRHWLRAFDPLPSIIASLLQWIRSSTHINNAQADNGFYQQTLDSKQPCQLIQISVPISANVFPEISVGRHRLAIRLLTFNKQDRAKQTDEDVPIKVHCCRL